MEIRVVLDRPDSAMGMLEEKCGLAGDLEQEDSYFVPPDRDFFKEDPTRKYLRVRHEIEGEEGGAGKGKGELGYYLCHFEDDGSLLYSEEYETEMGDPETTIELLQNLGMELKVTVRKRRKVFNYHGFELVVDRIEGLGYFLEIEVKDVEGSVEEKKEKCLQVLEKLNLDWSRAPEKGYPDMVLEEKSGQ